VAPHVVRDCPNGECEEFVAAPGVAAVDRAQQRGRPDLDQILVFGATAATAAREGLDERQVELSQAIARSTVAFFPVGDEEAPGGRLALTTCRMPRRMLLSNSVRNLLSHPNLDIDWWALFLSRAGQGDHTG
jgi:hypothetical protein